MYLSKIVNNFCRKAFTALAVTLLTVPGIQASEYKATAELDSAKLLMGRQASLILTVDVPENGGVTFPLLTEGQGRPYIPLLNDTIEISKNFKTDTISRPDAGRKLINYKFLLQAFDSGSYVLPPFLFLTAEGDTILTNKLNLTVLPVKVKADDKIDDFTHVVGPFDKEIPEGANAESSWFARYWWIILLSVLALGVAGWMWLRYRKEGTILPVKKEIPPYEAAMDSLRKLREKQLWENGKEKEYYTALTKILRVYLFKRFGIMAMEMTTAQLLRTLKNDDSLRRFRSSLREVLDMADFAKFAKVRPLAEDNERAFENVKDFVEATRPVEQPEKGGEA